MFTSRHCQYVAAGFMSLALSMVPTVASGAAYTGYFSGTISSYYFTTADVEPFVGTAVTGWYTFDIDNAAGMTVGSVTPDGIESSAGRGTGCSLHVNGSCISSEGTGPRFLTYSIHTRFGDFGPLPQFLELYEGGGIRVGQNDPNAFHENGSQYYFAGLDQGGSFQVTTPDAESDYLLTALNRYFGIALTSENDLLLPSGPLDLFQTPDFSAASLGSPPLTFFDNSFLGSCVLDRPPSLSRSCEGVSSETRFFVDLATLQIVAGEPSVPEPPILALLVSGLVGVSAAFRRKAKSIRTA